MSQRDGFTSGFLLGTIVGGVVGGLIGAIVANGRTQEKDESEASLLKSNSLDAKAARAKKRQIKDADGIEFARRSLEDKIAQLNSAIDEVRLSLGTVNGNVQETEKEQ